MELEVRGVWAPRGAGVFNPPRRACRLPPTAACRPPPRLHHTPAPAQAFSEDEGLQRDTTAVQLAAGRDIQGIPWELTQYDRDSYRVGGWWVLEGQLQRLGGAAAGGARALPPVPPSPGSGLPAHRRQPPPSPPFSRRTTCCQLSTALWHRCTAVLLPYRCTAACTAHAGGAQPRLRVVLQRYLFRCLYRCLYRRRCATAATCRTSTWRPRCGRPPPPSRQGRSSTPTAPARSSTPSTGVCGAVGCGVVGVRCGVGGVRWGQCGGVRCSLQFDPCGTVNRCCGPGGERGSAAAVPPGRSPGFPHLRPHRHLPCCCGLRRAQPVGCPVCVCAATGARCAPPSSTSS